MKSKIISLETARVLLNPKLNFDYETEFIYELDDTKIIKPSHIVWFDDYNLKPNQLIKNSCYPIFNGYPAPTQDELLNWIRIVWKYEVLVYCDASGWMWDLNHAFSTDSTQDGGTLITWSNDIDTNDSGIWNEYSDAMENGLLNTLQYIINNGK